MPAKPLVLVWDRVVRGTHWLVAACVIADLTLLESGTRLHRVVGYVACGLILLRVVWGFVGSGHARFSDWLPVPARLFPYLRQLVKGQEPRTLGHNPMGALMMLFLWSLVLSLGLTGYAMGTDAGFGVEWLEELHDGLADVLYASVALHVMAAVLAGWRHGENLILGMITGKKAAAVGEDV